MPVDYPLHIDLALLFREWNAQRVARFLEVNPRTLQRWLKDAEGELGSLDMPENLRDKVREQARIMRDLQFFEWLEKGIDDARDDGLHSEIIASNLAVMFKRLTGREVE